MHDALIHAPAGAPHEFSRPPVRPRKRQRWSERELTVMRERYPTGGLRACAPLLPDRNEGAIYGMARVLRLYAPNQDVVREHWTTTPHIDEAIRRAYVEDARRGMLQRLAKRIRRPARWISHRARQLGIAPPRFREPLWSEAEIALLRQHAHKSIPWIARLLARHGFRRSANAINVKRVRLHCVRQDDDRYTAAALAELMGVLPGKVRTWIDRGLLKATRHTDTDGSQYRIHYAAVRRFIVANVGAIDLRRVDKHWFVDLLAGEAR